MDDCLADVSAPTFCKMSNVAFGGGNAGAWSSLNAAIVGCRDDKKCGGFYKNPSKEIYYKSGEAYGKNVGKYMGYTSWLKPRTKEQLIAGKSNSGKHVYKIIDYLSV